MDIDLEENKDFGELIEKRVLRSALVKDMRKRGLKEGLRENEQAGNIRLIRETFGGISDPETILTETMKLKRHSAYEYFKAYIDDMYGEGSLIKREQESAKKKAK